LIHFSRSCRLDEQRGMLRGDWERPINITQVILIISAMHGSNNQFFKPGASACYNSGYYGNAHTRPFGKTTPPKDQPDASAGLINVRSTRFDSEADCIYATVWVGFAREMYYDVRFFGVLRLMP